MKNLETIDQAPKQEATKKTAFRDKLVDAARTLVGGKEKTIDTKSENSESDQWSKELAAKEQAALDAYKGEHPNEDLENVKIKPLSEDDEKMLKAIGEQGIVVIKHHRSIEEMLESDKVKINNEGIRLFDRRVGSLSNEYFFGQFFNLREKRNESRDYSYVAMVASMSEHLEDLPRQKDIYGDTLKHEVDELVSRNVKNLSADTFYEAAIEGRLPIGAERWLPRSKRLSFRDRVEGHRDYAKMVVYKEGGGLTLEFVRHRQMSD